jgi:dihydrofolate reductase
VQVGEWNATIIKGDVSAEVTRLKAESGRDLLIYGSGELVDSLTRAGLIDEYRLMVHPVIVGAGKRLFQGLASGFATTNLRLANATTTSAGVAVLTYAKAS